MKTKYLKYALAALMLLAVQGCKTDKIMHYEGGGTLYFSKHATRYSFVDTPFEEKAVVEVELVVGGFTQDFERPIPVKVADMGVNTTASQFRLLDNPVIEAGADRGYVAVEVSNPDYLDTEETELFIILEIGENEHFRPGGFKEYFITTLEWSSLLQQPDTWKDMAVFFCSTYSTNCYKAIIEATGLREFYYYSPNPETGIRATESEGKARGKVFGDWIRKYNATHDEPYKHDDGAIVVPKY